MGDKDHLQKLIKIRLSKRKKLKQKTKNKIIHVPITQYAVIATVVAGLNWIVVLH